MDFWTSNVHFDKSAIAAGGNRGLREMNSDRVRIPSAPAPTPSLVLPPNWTERSACLDHADLFDQLYPREYDGRGMAPGHREAEREARRVCGSCPVKDECLEFAMERETGPFNQWRYGMFGGLMPSERKRLAAERGA